MGASSAPRGPTLAVTTPEGAPRLVERPVVCRRPGCREPAVVEALGLCEPHQLAYKAELARSGAGEGQAPGESQRQVREPYSGRALAELAELLEASGWHIEGGETRRPTWHARAACRGVGADLFFPSRRQSERAYQAAVERYCQRCPVRPECAEAGEHERFGLWGGRSPRRRQKRAAAA